MSSSGINILSVNPTASVMSESEAVTNFLLVVIYTFLILHTSINFMLDS